MPIMLLANLKIQKVIIFVIFIFFLLAPVYSSNALVPVGFGVPVNDMQLNANYSIKEYILDLVARKLASEVLNKVGGQVANLINKGGRDNEPAFIRNWRQFVVGSSQRGENVFREEIANIVKGQTACSGSRDLLDTLFSKNKVNNNFINDSGKLVDLKTFIGGKDDSLRANNLDSFQLRTKCTIPDKVFTDYNRNFQKGGGWETWSRLVEPQNNPYGLLAMSLDELNTQRDIEERADTGETRSGGFVGKHDQCQGRGSNAKCTFFGKTLTPSKILGEAGAKAVDDKFDWLTNSHEISEVIISVIESSFKRLDNFLNEKTGSSINLTGVSEDVSGIKQAQQAECISKCFRTANQACGQLNSDNTEELNACLDQQETVCRNQCK